MSRVFLPVRRGDAVLVFEHVENADEKRWDFVAAAAADAAGAPLRRTGAVGLDAEAFSAVEDAARRLPEIEKTFAAARIFDERSTASILYKNADAAIVDGSLLMTFALYLQFMRQTLVHEAAIQRYEQQTPETRADVGLTASLLHSLLRRHELTRAERIIATDIAALERASQRHSEWGYLYGLAATVKERLEKPSEALDLLNKAVRVAPGEGTWRRIGNAHANLGNTASAITAFENAEKIAPLGGRPSLRLAWWYCQSQNWADAWRWLERAEERGARDGGQLRARLQQDAARGSAPDSAN